MRMIFMGTPDFAVPALRALLGAGHHVAAVYTQPPRPAGRGKRPRPSPVAQAAAEAGLDVRHPETLRDAHTQAAFAALRADLAVVVAYGLLLPDGILDAPRFGCVNIHGSILPRWRGAAPIQRAIMAGDSESGVAIMRMATGLDTGPVYAMARTPIGAADTTGTLHDRLAQMGAQLLVQTLPEITTQEPTPQPDHGVTYATKIDKAEAEVDWTRPAAEVDRLIRGLSPFPGAWTTMNGARVKLLGSIVDGNTPDDSPGRILPGLRIVCGDGRTVQITRAQRAGKAAADADTLLRGFDPGGIAGV